MQNRIDILIAAYCSNRLTADEARELDAWLSSSRRNQVYFRKRIESHDYASQQVEHAWERFAAKNETLFATPRKERFGRVFMRRAAGFAAAAVLMLGAVIAFVPFDSGYMSGKHAVNEFADRLEYRTGRGEKMDVVLPDGSTVCLNSETRLVVAADFGESTREISFDGEGFFNIARDPERPFIIHSADDDYTVLGTSFNLQSYAREKFAVVTLHTGCLQARVRKDVIILDPNEELQIDAENNTIAKREVNVDDSISWINGRLVFSGLPLKDVANKLSRHFQVRINVHADIANQQYTGMVDDETLEEALNMIAETSPRRMRITNIEGEYFLSQANPRPLNAGK